MLAASSERRKEPIEGENFKVVCRSLFHLVSVWVAAVVDLTTDNGLTTDNYITGDS
jgi:hypothetical protein